MEAGKAEGRKATVNSSASRVSAPSAQDSATQPRSRSYDGCASYLVLPGSLCTKVDGMGVGRSSCDCLQGLAPWAQRGACGCRRRVARPRCSCRGSYGSSVRRTSARVPAIWQRRSGSRRTVVKSRSFVLFTSVEFVAVVRGVGKPRPARLVVAGAAALLRARLSALWRIVTPTQGEASRQAARGGGSAGGVALPSALNTVVPQGLRYPHPLTATTKVPADAA